jgi:hypothetical protein
LGFGLLLTKSVSTPSECCIDVDELSLRAFALLFDFLVAAIIPRPCARCLALPSA